MEYQNTIEELKHMQCKVGDKEKKFYQLQETNRKNNGKLYEAKIKLIKAQNTRKLLGKLHDIDDENL